MNALRHGRGRGFVCAGLLVATSVGYEVAAAQVACPIYQVTRTIDVGLGFENNHPSINDAGTRIAFVSAADLAGDNPGLFAQIFLYDTGLNSFDQITDVNADTYCSTCEAYARVNNPSLSDNGTRIAFASYDDLTGDNPDHDEEIFLYRTATSELTQVTETAGDAGGSANSWPAISGNGMRIAFETGADLAGPNDDLNDEIVLYDVPSDTFTRITDTDSETTNDGFNAIGGINADGTRVAFFSRFDLLGANPNESSELFLFDSTFGQTFQLTDWATTLDGVFSPSINGDGSLIAFSSTVANPGCFAPSGNADNNAEIVRIDTAAGNSCIQVTHTTGGHGFGNPAGANHSSSINADGDRIAFLSNRNLTGQNADGNREVFRFDANDSSFVQVTKSTGAGNAANEPPSISGDGNRIAFSSTRNLTGQNGDGNRELFLAACVVPPSCDGMTPTIVGTPFNDILSGTSGIDVIVGLDGADTIDGLGGLDRICGGNGNDTLRGGGGNDRVFGQGGNDALNGQGGTDVCNGGGGTDSAAACETTTSIP